jgi:hypothetical protein
MFTAFKNELSVKITQLSLSLGLVLVTKGILLKVLEVSFNAF